MWQSLWNRNEFGPGIGSWSVESRSQGLLQAIPAVQFLEFHFTVNHQGRIIQAQQSPAQNGAQESASDHRHFIYDQVKQQWAQCWSLWDVSALLWAPQLMNKSSHRILAGLWGLLQHIHALRIWGCRNNFDSSWWPWKMFQNWPMCNRTYTCLSMVHPADNGME